MKWIAVILSLYVFCLVSLPCADTCYDGCTQHTEQQSPGSDTHKTSDDTCSPFCVCSCCNVMVTIASFVVLPAPVEQVYSQIFPNYQGQTSRFNTSIWQPPKVNA